MENVSLLKFKYLLAEFRETKDPKFSAEICELLLNGSLKVQPTSKDGKLLFILASRYNSKCCRCGEKYECGDPLFVQNQRAWHLNCAEDKELEHKLFKDALDKGLIEDFELKPKKKSNKKV